MTQQTFQHQLSKLKDLMPIVKAASNPTTTSLFRFLFDRIKNPDSYVVMLGETSSGKSSIINGILGANILPVSARPSTGTISEIVFSNEVSKIEFYECTKDAALKEITHDEFNSMTWKPNKNTSRLRVMMPSHGFNPGLRLFDTPGYNSIVEDHEEILREFLPNADAVVYTVSYRIGIQNEDFNFLRFLRELIGEDIPVIVVINRCPEGVDFKNKRVKEISQYIKDILGKTPEIFLMPVVIPENEGQPVLPKNEKMWKYVTETLNSTARHDKIAAAFDGFILDLFNQCDAVIKNRLAKAKMSSDEIKGLLASQKEYANGLRKAIPELIKPTFANIIKKIPQKVEEVSEAATRIIFADIEKSDRLDMEEEVAFINSHLLPFTIQTQGKDIINRFIEVEILDLNKRVDDYIQKETVKFNDKIAIQLKTNTDSAIQGLLAKGLGKLGSTGLTRYVIQFGGAGGANAGVANAASHLLKKAGDFFGKTFSRSTHNGLKHVLAKIGATSMKRVGGAIAVIAELLVFAVEVSVWKKKARSKVEKALRKWRDESVPEIIKDIEKLEAQNIATINDLAFQEEHAFDDEIPEDNWNIEELQAESDMADAWLKTYGK